jgi:hypothetical protein
MVDFGEELLRGIYLGAIFLRKKFVVVEGLILRTTATADPLRG